MDTDHDCSYKRVGNWKHQILNSTKPRSKKMIYVITGSQSARKLTKIEFLNLSHYAPRNAYVHFPQILGTSYGTDTEQIRTYSWKLFTVLPEQKRCFDYQFSMDIRDCNSEFLMTLFEDNVVDWLIFHSFSLRLQIDKIVCNWNNTGNE